MRRFSAALVVVCYWLYPWIATAEQDAPIRQLTDIRSGYFFQSEEIQALQNDDFASPGLLWRDQGEALFSATTMHSETACADCHSETSLMGAAARYPQYHPTLKRLINLEQRINLCRQEKQQRPAWAYESEPLLAMTTYIASLSDGMPFNVDIDGPARPFFDQGEAYYYTRLGQLNLACQHCHEANDGQRLRGDILSQGHSNNYPTYRLDWQTQGSLHRRLRFCNYGVRAEQLPYGDAIYVNLELYLAWRAGQMPLEIPSVRR